MTIHRGDCFDLLPKVVDQVDLILTDPPYGVTRNRWDIDVDWDQWWEMIPGKCPVVMFAAGKFAYDVVASAAARFRYEWIWSKNRVTGHLNASKRPMVSHEKVLVFCGVAPPYYPQKSQGHAPLNSYYTSRSGTTYGGTRKAGTGGGSTERYPRSVLHFDAVAPSRRRHPSEKPRDLLEYLVRTYTKPGDLVADPFAGSGSTLEAAEAAGRRSWGCDKN